MQGPRDHTTSKWIKHHTPRCTRKTCSSKSTKINSCKYNWEKLTLPFTVVFFFSCQCWSKQILPWSKLRQLLTWSANCSAAQRAPSVKGSNKTKETLLFTNSCSNSRVTFYPQRFVSIRFELNLVSYSYSPVLTQNTNPRFTRHARPAAPSSIIPAHLFLTDWFSINIVVSWEQQDKTNSFISIQNWHRNPWSAVAHPKG